MKKTYVQFYHELRALIEKANEAQDAFLAEGSAPGTVTISNRCDIAVGRAIATLEAELPPDVLALFVAVFRGWEHRKMLASESEDDERLEYNAREREKYASERKRLATCAV